MKKYLQLLFLLFIFYYIFRILFNFLFEGYSVKYSLEVLDNKFNIEEKYTPYSKGESKNFYFNINVNDKDYVYKVYGDLKGKKKKIVDIKYILSDGYECVLPIFENSEVHTNMLCSKDGVFLYYNSIKGKNKDIDDYVSRIENYKILENNLDNVSNEGALHTYPNNYCDIKLMISSYNGIYIADKKGIEKVNIFSKDVYSQKIVSHINNLYFIADYSNIDKGFFTDVYLVDLKSKKVDKFSSKYKISFEGYVQGVVSDSVYYFDEKNKTQYEINLKTKKIVVAGNEKRGIKIYDKDRFRNYELRDVLNNHDVFKYKDVIYDGENFSKLIGGSKTGFYYKFIKKGNKYSVYESFIEKEDYSIYLFDIEDLSNLNFVDSYIIYNEEEIIKCFNKNIGLVDLGKYSEFNFNKDIHIYAFN